VSTANEDRNNRNKAKSLESLLILPIPLGEGRGKGSPKILDLFPILTYKNIRGSTGNLHREGRYLMPVSKFINTALDPEEAWLFSPSGAAKTSA